MKAKASDEIKSKMNAVMDELLLLNEGDGLQLLLLLLRRLNLDLFFIVILLIVSFL